MDETALIISISPGKREWNRKKKTVRGILELYEYSNENRTLMSF